MKNTSIFSKGQISTLAAIMIAALGVAGSTFDPFGPAETIKTCTILGPTSNLAETHSPKTAHPSCSLQ